MKIRTTLFAMTALSGLVLATVSPQAQDFGAAADLGTLEANLQSDRALFKGAKACGTMMR